MTWFSHMQRLLSSLQRCLSMLSLPHYTRILRTHTSDSPKPISAMPVVNSSRKHIYNINNLPFARYYFGRSVLVVFIIFEITNIDSAAD